MVSLVLAVVLVGGAVQRSHPMLLAWLIWQAGETHGKKLFNAKKCLFWKRELTYLCKIILVEYDSLYDLSIVRSIKKYIS